MLSEAKHLSAARDKPFAEFTLSGSEGLRVTVEVPISSSVLFFESSSTDASVTNTTGEFFAYLWIWDSPTIFDISETSDISVINDIKFSY
jgi:hypothetical protein